MSTKQEEDLTRFAIPDGLRKTSVVGHAEDCASKEGGPCTCGLEEVIADEVDEETRAITAEEETSDERD